MQHQGSKSPSFKDELYLYSIPYEIIHSNFYETLLQTKR